MKSIFASLAVAVAFSASTFAQTLTVNTPGPAVVCQPLLITWLGGTPPYFLSLLPGGQPSAAALLDFGEQTGTQLTWVVNQTAGTSLGLNLRDQTGTIAQSGMFTVQSGSDLSCLTSTGSTTTTGSTTGSGSTTTPTSPATSTTPTAPATTPTTPASSVTPGTTTKPTSTTGTNTAAPTTTSNAASLNMANAGLAGAFGIGAALMALVL